MQRERILEGGPVTTAAVSRSHEFVEEALRWLPDTSARQTHPEISVSGLNALTVQGDLSQNLGKRILLADDNADMRAYVGRLLEAQGYEVVLAADGQAALELAHERKPHLILTDVMMPRLDGFGLLRAVRTNSALADTPVIMLSARAGEEAKVEGLDAGADDYLIKPFAARELVARVHSNIQMAEIRREAARAVFKSEQRFLMTRERLGRALSTGRVAVFDWSVDSDRLTIHGPLAEVFGVDALAGRDRAAVAAFRSGDRTAAMSSGFSRCSIAPSRERRTSKRIPGPRERPGARCRGFADRLPVMQRARGT